MPLKGDFCGEMCVCLRSPSQKPFVSFSKVSFVGFHIWSDFGPTAPRPRVDLPELVSVTGDPRRIIECAGRQCANARNGFKREAEVGAAFAAELDFKPPAGLVGMVTVLDDGVARNRDMLRRKDNLHPKCRSGSSLAPETVANRDTQRIIPCLEADFSAHAAACLIHEYDLTEFEWKTIQPLLPNEPRAIPRVDHRKGSACRRFAQLAAICL
jgi:hypothetical protein